MAIEALTCYYEVLPYVSIAVTVPKVQKRFSWMLQKKSSQSTTSSDSVDDAAIGGEGEGWGREEGRDWR